MLSALLMFRRLMAAMRVALREEASGESWQRRRYS
jgi:hypothetical protein